MSNPSGPDEDPTSADAEAQAPTEEAERPTTDATTDAATDETEQPSEAPTEVISRGEPEPQFESAEPTVVLSGSEQQPTQKRYSAPSGFDVRSTEVIRTPAEPATDVMSTSGTPPPPPAASRPVAPQTIPPRPGRHRSWGLVLALILVIAALAAVAVLGTVWLTHKASSKASQEELVRETIQEFDTAVQKGDLPKLRGITCGTTRDDYVHYPDKDWATTYPRIAAAKQYPVVASIDQVVVNDQHAEANVTSFMAYAPQVRSTRSFDLRFLDGRWKICEGPIT